MLRWGWGGGMESQMGPQMSTRPHCQTACTSQRAVSDFKQQDTGKVLCLGSFIHSYRNALHPSNTCSNAESQKKLALTPSTGFYIF